MLHPWQPANLTLAKPSRCHCQVPGALCAVPWGRGHFRSLQSFFLRLFCLQGWLLFSSAHHHHHQHRTHCGSSTFTLFFFSFLLLRAQSLPPHSASWFASFFLLLSRRCLSAQQAFCSAFAVPPFPSAFAVFEPSSTCFLFSLFTTLSVALYCTYADVPDCIVSVLCIYLSFFLFTCCFFYYLVTGSARKLYFFFFNSSFSPSEPVVPQSPSSDLQKSITSTRTTDICTTLMVLAASCGPACLFVTLDRAQQVSHLPCNKSSVASW